MTHGERSRDFDKQVKEVLDLFMSLKTLPYFLPESHKDLLRDEIVIRMNTAVSIWEKKE